MFRLPEPSTKVRLRIGWKVAPDKTEAWLERMAAKGYFLNPERYFGLSLVKGKPRRVVYAIDYQRRPKTDYFELQKEAGWQLCDSRQASRIWMQDWEDGSPRPVFYSDFPSKVEHAKRVARYSAFSYFSTVFGGLGVFINAFLREWFDYQRIDWYFLICIFILFTVYGYFVFRAIFYYRRMKKSLQP